MQPILNRPSNHTPETSRSRSEMVQEILGSHKGKTVLVIGIGGGGDVVGTLPTCFDLERLGATVIPGGLTWKRAVHDPLARPRPLSSFSDVTVLNDLIGEASVHTKPIDAPAHIESHVSRALNGRPVMMIDITLGSAAVTSALLDYKQKRNIDAIIGIDAGGDVLCFGDEQTLQSPICDQVMLGALSHIPGSLLGVFGFGGDGEMTIDALHLRFDQLCSVGAFRGGLPIAEEDLENLRRILLEAPTEASRLPLEHAFQLSAQQRSSLVGYLSPVRPNLREAIGTPRFVTMRDGFRTATLSNISASTLFFNPGLVFGSSRLGKLCDPRLTVDQLNTHFSNAGITTEFTAESLPLHKA